MTASDTVYVMVTVVALLLGVIGYMWRRNRQSDDDTQHEILQRVTSIQDDVAQIKTTQARQGDELSRLSHDVRDHEHRIRTLEHPTVRNLGHP